MAEPVPPEEIAPIPAASAPPQPVEDKNILPINEGDGLESPERIARTRLTLVNLATAASEFSEPFYRNIEVFKVDPPTTADPRPYEHWVPLDTGDKNLRTIELRSFVNEETGEAYHLALSFLPNAEGKPDLTQPLMLTVDYPIPMNLGNFNHAGAWEAGVTPTTFRFQDFMYKDGATSVPVREADFTYVYSYRPDGPGFNYDATEDQMDGILKLLANSHVMKKAETQPGGNRKWTFDKGPRAIDLVPELKSLPKPSSS